MTSLRARLDDIDPERAWLAAFVALVGGFVAGSIVLRELVWDRFIWQYFWGPVEADAKGAACAVMEADGPRMIASGSECGTLKAGNAIYAEPGYTLVSEVGYMVVLVFMLIGVYLLANRLRVGGDLGIYFALIPFMLFGGALRVVEDAFDRALEVGLEPGIGYPLNTLFISPLIYGTVFVIALTTLVAAVRLDERGAIGDYRILLGTVGTAALGVCLTYLTYLSVTTEYVSAYPQMAAVVLVLASGISYAIYRGFEAKWPEIISGIGAIGFFVIWAHAIDGVANVLTADWLKELGVVNSAGNPLPYSPKHPANDFIIAVTESLQPAGLTAAIGSSWPFLLIKLGVASAILWLFTEDFVEESTNYALLLLIAVTAVGLGPGTRDFIRVTFGI